MKPLQAALQKHGDSKVGIAKWEPEADEEIPDVKRVLKTRFWEAPEYKSVRERLAKPLPKLQVSQQGGYVTIENKGVAGGVPELAGPLEGDPNSGSRASLSARVAFVFGTQD